MESNRSLVHVVLISFRPDASHAQQEEIFDRYQSLAAEAGGAPAGILYFAVQKNLDQRKNIALVELAVFRDEAAFRAFLVHPRHKEIQELLRASADWWVGDYHDLPHISS